jgi:hypothetical protein
MGGGMQEGEGEGAQSCQMGGAEKLNMAETARGEEGERASTYEVYVRFPSMSLAAPVARERIRLVRQMMQKSQMGASLLQGSDIEGYVSNSTTQAHQKRHHCHDRDQDEDANERQQSDLLRCEPLQRRPGSPPILRI